MKSKQLTNVLIKMLGLSICLYAIPSFVAGILRAFADVMASKGGNSFLYIISSSVGAAIQAAVGIAIIAKSQKIAGWMFKSEDE